MADGLNDARAMRISEVMTDLRTDGHRIPALLASNPNDRSVGSLIMNQCKAEITALLARPFNSGPSLQVPGGDPENIKSQLKRVLLDAAARRLQARKIYLKAQAAAQNVMQKRQITRGGPARPEHQRALQQADQTIRTALVAITDTRVFDELKRQDAASGHWTAEMPDLGTILAFIRRP